MAKGIRSSLYIEGLNATVKAYRQLPKEVKDLSDDLVRKISAFVATRTRGAASTPAEHKVAATIKSQKNSVSLGGGGARSRAGSMALGTEFGGRGRRTTQQFRPHLGTVGYFFWPTIRANSNAIKGMWDDLLEKVGTVH